MPAIYRLLGGDRSTPDFGCRTHRSARPGQASLIRATRMGSTQLAEPGGRTNPGTASSFHRKRADLSPGQTAVRPSYLAWPRAPVRGPETGPISPGERPRLGQTPIKVRDRQPVTSRIYSFYPHGAE